MWQLEFVIAWKKIGFGGHINLEDFSRKRYSRNSKAKYEATSKYYERMSGLFKFEFKANNPSSS